MPENREKYDIRFNITDSDGNPIEGATVRIDDDTSNTGSAGGCTLKNIEEGTHTVYVTSEGYITATEIITVSESQNSFTIILTESD